MDNLKPVGYAIEGSEMMSGGQVDLETCRQIIKACVKSFRFMEQVKDEINEMNLFSGQAFYSMIWSVLYDYFQRYNDLPSLRVYEKELKERFYSNPDDYPSYDYNSVRYYLKEWLEEDNFTTQEEDYFFDVFDEIYQSWVQNNVQQTLVSEEDPEKKVKAVRKLNETLQSSSRSQFSEKKVFLEDPNKFLHSEPRQPTHVPLIDDLTNGGPHPGETAIIIMPSGGGKTTLGVQLMEASILQGKHCVHHSIEQQFEGDLALRYYVRATDSLRKYWEIGSANDVFQQYPKIKKKYDAAAPTWAQYLHMFDQWADPEVYMNSIHDLFKPVEKLYDEQGIKTQYLVVDWWGAMLNKLLRGDQISDTNLLKHYMSDLVGALKGYTEKCVKKGIPLRTIVFHQLAGSVAEHATSNKRVSAYSSQGDKDLTNLFNFGGAASGLSDEYIFTFNRTKVRDGQIGSNQYRLNGQRCIIERLDAETQNEIKAAQDYDKRFASQSGRKRN